MLQKGCATCISTNPSMPEFCVPQKIHFYDRRNGGATFPSPNSKSDLAVQRAFLTRTQNRAPLLEVTLSQTVQGNYSVYNSTFWSTPRLRHEGLPPSKAYFQKVFRSCGERQWKRVLWSKLSLRGIAGLFFHVSFFAQPVLIFLRTWARSDWLATWKLHNWVFTRIKKRNCQCFMCLIQ